MEGHWRRLRGRVSGFEVPSLRAVLRGAWALDRPLTFVGVLMVATFVGTMVGLFLDPRVITGVPAWLKPAKFAVSISIYSFTLLWLLTYVRGWRRTVRTIAFVSAAGLALEEIIICLQVVRGTTSHFNVGTPLDGLLWSTMGSLIVLVFIANLAAAVLLLLQRLPHPAFAWSLRLGILLSLVGMAVAFLMTTPTPAQLAAAEAGGAMPNAGAHAVGVEDGEPGLPVVGWSTTGGDLRVAHFVGLHALQVMPLLGFLVVSSRSNWLKLRHRVALVWTFGLAYLGLVLLLTWQALRGQPLLSPDAATLGVLSAIALVAGGGALAVTLHAHRKWRNRFHGIRQTVSKHLVREGGAR